MPATPRYTEPIPSRTRVFKPEPRNQIKPQTELACKVCYMCFSLKELEAKVAYLDGYSIRPVAPVRTLPSSNRHAPVNLRS